MYVVVGRGSSVVTVHVCRWTLQAVSVRACFLMVWRKLGSCVQAIDMLDSLTSRLHDNIGKQALLSVDVHWDRLVMEL